MESLYNMDEWVLDKTAAIEDTLANITIYLRYPDYRQFLQFKPKERIKEIDSLHKRMLKQLKALKVFDAYSLVGTKKRPRGVHTTLRLGDLHKLKEIDYLSVSIQSIAGVEKIRKEETPKEKFFCVKMTVVIDIEGLQSKKQKIEKRLVLIKANSAEDAYSKVETSKDSYGEPYLNSSGRVVRWLIDSLDDCYETDVFRSEEFNNPQGIEVYSKLKTRREKR